MTNSIKLLKAQHEGKKIMNELNKLKKEAPTEYMWYALAYCTGNIMSAADVVNIFGSIAKVKKSYPEIDTAPKERISPKKYELEYTDDAKKDHKVKVYEKERLYYTEDGSPFTLFPTWDIEKCGVLLNPETERELLNDTLLKFKDSTKELSKHFLGNFYTNAVFKKLD